jgi:pyrroloquinoline quinone (PQQ) biosynthesis protein C
MRGLSEDQLRRCVERLATAFATIEGGLTIDDVARLATALGVEPAMIVGSTPGDG